MRYRSSSIAHWELNQKLVRAPLLTGPHECCANRVDQVRKQSRVFLHRPSGQVPDVVIALQRPLALQQAGFLRK